MTARSSRRPSAALLAGAEEGQTIVLLAVALPMLLALLLVVIDGGRLYVERERLRGAAQLAAYAGTSALAELPPAQQRDTERARGSIDPVIREALARNLPGTTFTYSFEMPLRDARSGGDIVVHVNSPFAASIQRITLGIGAMGTVRLSPPATPTPAAQHAPAAIAPPAPRATPAPTPTPAPQATATPAPTPTPVPTASPAPTPWAATVLASQELAVNTIGITVQGGSVYVADYPVPSTGTEPGRLVITDAALSGKPTAVQLDPNSYGLAVDASRQRAYVAHVYPPQLTIVDTGSGRVIKEIPIQGYRAQKVELDRSTGRVYVTAFCDSVRACNEYAVLVFDAGTGALLSTIKPDRRPREILVDSTHKRAYANETFDGSISVIDTAANTILRRIKLPGQAAAVALDEARDRIYALDSSGRFVTILEGASGNTVGTIDLGLTGSGIGLALDPSSGRVYVSASKSGWDPVARKHTTSATLIAADGLTAKVIGSAAITGAAGQLAFDPATKRLYHSQGLGYATGKTLLSALSG